MKKTLITILAYLMAILTITLTACGDDKNGTYYPTNEEMKTNLESSGYVVTLYQDLTDNNNNHHDGTLLFASKSRENEQEEYLYFYRFKNANSCEYYYNSLGQNCENYNSLVKIENDEKFGNIVYCGTENAISASGIKVVEVKVKV